MPIALARLLDSKLFLILARIVLTFVFWGAGLGKLIDFQGGAAEMAHFGLEPAGPVNALVVATLLVGSALVVLDRHAWLGCGMLAVFTALTIPLVHHFWSMDGEEALAHFHTAAEHVTVIGALMVMAILSHRTSPNAVRAGAAGPAFADGRTG